MDQSKMIIKGDCIEEMKKLKENSIDAIITDPPYGIGFMGKEWDNFNPTAVREATQLSSRKKSYLNEKRSKDARAGASPAFEAGRYNRTLHGQTGFQFWFQEVAKECLRVLKPGGFLLSFGGTRTYHRLVCGIEDAGFEIRDTIMWLYATGFPKSLNIGKQIDKINGKTQEEFIALGKYLREKRGETPQNQISKFFPSKTGGLTGCVSNWELGMNVPTKEQWIILKRELKLNNKFDYLIDRIEAEREVIGKDGRTAKDSIFGIGVQEEWNLTKAELPEAKEWEGWGTALKPAVEPIVVARKPLSEKNVALNVLKWGTGGINIDASRIGNEIIKSQDDPNKFKNFKEQDGRTPKEHKFEPKEVQGRFPANIILDEKAGKMLDEQSGNLSVGNYNKRPLRKINNWMPNQKEIIEKTDFNDKGGASRFFYCAKASKSERNFGCEDLEEREEVYPGANTFDENGNRLRKDGSIIPPLKSRNNHPTVKPIKLMEYLIKLVSREGATILDPFVGSGTTGIASIKLNRKFIGIEKEEEYIEIAKARMKPFLEQQKLF